jgi:hypothetical protein
MRLCLPTKLKQSMFYCHLLNLFLLNVMLPFLHGPLITHYIPKIKRQQQQHKLHRLYGAALSAEGPEPFLPLAHATCKQAAADGLEHKWNTKWHRHHPCRQTRIFFPNSNRINSQSILFHPPKDLGLLSRHLLGHSYLNYHQSKQIFGLEPICCLCGKQKEESHHIIFTCPTLSQLRLHSLC